jgi:hypothetical protein
MSEQRSRCPFCARPIRVDTSGELVVHGKGRRCRGGGLTPEKAAAALEEHRAGVVLQDGAFEVTALEMVEAAARGASKGVGAAIKAALERAGLSEEEAERLMREDLQAQQDRIERRRQLEPMGLAEFFEFLKRHRPFEGQWGDR